MTPWEKNETSMPEPIRLVIWDLDGTFWDGVVTEGGFTFKPENGDLVIELARRGIMSSICSKNDFATVEAILREHGVWDYFVLPSINWEPKGPRLAALVEDFQLRPQTILFIDDNPSNIEEARQHVEGLQLCSDLFIPEIGRHPLFKGKDDRELKRLAQYKVLEQRKADAASVGTDVSAFLRASGIRVKLEFDLRANMDRVIELVNRTNQLNFTKERIPEGVSHEEAIRLLKIDHYATQGALVHVVDRYGDHGYCGLYLYQSIHRRLDQFCFSCRILGMGVEQWLFEKLGRPKINVKGEVLTDLFAPHPLIDWISQTQGEMAQAEGTQRSGRVVARGACSLGAVVHYFGATFPEAVGEYHLYRGGLPRRIDHTEFVWQGLQGLSEPALAAARKLGYAEEDFETRLFEPDNKVILLGLATDGDFALYRHRATGLTVPLEFLPRFAFDRDAIAEGGKPEAEPARSLLAHLRTEYEFVGLIDETGFKRNLKAILARVAHDAHLFLLMTPIPPKSARLHNRWAELDRWIREVHAETGRGELVYFNEYVQESADMNDNLHFSRDVYHRLYLDLVRRLDAPAGSAQTRSSAYSMNEPVAAI